MSSAAISVEHLSKAYRIGQKEEVHDTLAGVMLSWARAPLRNFRQLRRLNTFDLSGSSEEEDVLWSLRDVSFEVQPGEVLGIIGRNGAGKSTLLKILSRITAPTAGRAVIRGRVSSLLEVGTGFHPELTGRENIYMNGTILGMRKREIDLKFDNIVDFSGVERFIDTPVKRYSSGMKVRLAFAVAAHLEPEILIIDEVLAVGDAEFQRKCLGKMQDVASHGRTVLFVSHNMAAMRSLCRTGLLLDGGQVTFSGDIDACTERYSSNGVHAVGQWVRDHSEHGRAPVHFSTAGLELLGHQPQHALRVSFDLTSTENHPDAFVAIDILNSHGAVVMQAMPSNVPFVSSSNQRHELSVDIDLPPLIPGTYHVTLWVGTALHETLDEVRAVLAFDVNDAPAAGRTYPYSLNHGSIVPPSRMRYTAFPIAENGSSLI